MMAHDLNNSGTVKQTEYFNGEESDPLASCSEGVGSDVDSREEIFGPDIDKLIAETQNKRRKRKKRRFAGHAAAKRRRPCDIPPSLTSVMGAATMSFMVKDYAAAEASLLQIIQEAPKASSPYRTLGLIHEERGDRRKAIDAYMKAAHLDNRECELWKRNAALWEEEGNMEQAVFCLTRAIKVRSGRDVEALRARAEFRIRLGQHRKAADGYLKLAQMLPNDIDVLKKAVSLYRGINQHAKVVPLLQSSIEYFQQGFSRRDGITSAVQRNRIILELVQMLIEVWFKQKKYAESSALLSRVKVRLSSTGSPMTFEQRLLLAICQHRLGAETLASPTFIEFMSSPSMMAKHQSLLWEVADACLDSGDYQKAVKAYNLLDSTGTYSNNLLLYLRRASCYQQLGNPDRCKEDLLSVLRIKPRHVEASMRLMEYYPEVMRQKQILENKKRRLRRREKAASSRAAVLQNIQHLKLNPDAPASLRRSTWGAIGYDYLTNSSTLSGITMDDGILMPVSYEDIRVALQILGQAETAFVEGNYELFLSFVGPPIETALNLTNKLSADKDDQSEDEEFDLEDSEHSDRHSDARLTNSTDGDSGSGAMEKSVVQRLPRPSSPLTKNQPSNDHKRKKSGSDCGVIEGAVQDVHHKEADEDVIKNLAKDDGTQARLDDRDSNKLNEIGVALLRELEDKLFAGLLEQIFEALYNLERIDDIEPIMSSLLAIAAIRIGPDSPLKLRMQVLLVVSLFATGRYYDAYNKLRSMMIQSPDDSRICCLFAIAEEHMGVSSQYDRFRSFRVLDRLYKKRQDLPILTYVTGLCSARGLNNSHNYTVGKYLQAYSGVSESPLLCLCLVVQLVYVAQNRRVGNRNQIVMYAMAFLDEYRRKRKARSSNQCTTLVELELLYNSGRTMHQLGVLHMAEQLYRSMLESTNKHLRSLPIWGDLRRDAAHNLVCIYKQSGSFEMARSLVNDYLVF